MENKAYNLVYNRILLSYKQQQQCIIELLTNLDAYQNNYAE